MKRPFLVMALLLSASAAFAGTTTQKWTAGWDRFNEPLHYKESKLSWSVNRMNKTLTVTYTLVGAKPSKLYQVGVEFYCTMFRATFGQFPTFNAPGGQCTQVTRQDVTKTVAGATFGVVTTDIHGNGSFTVIVGPIASGTYDVSFWAWNGAGCMLKGGGGKSTCFQDFQSPGPTFGDATEITIP